MPILINLKICDNAAECDGITNCPTGAFYYDDKIKSIRINKDKCIECGKCACCPVGAIHFAKNQTEYNRIKKEIENDPRRPIDLFVDRYGATPVNEDYLLDEKDFDERVLKYPKTEIIEVLKDKDIQCLIKCTPIKDLVVDHPNIRYRKMVPNTNEVLRRFNIKNFPALLFFRDGELIGKVEGFVDYSNRDRLKKEINSILE